MEETEYRANQCFYLGRCQICPVAGYPEPPRKRLAGGHGSEPYCGGVKEEMVAS